MYTAPHTLTYTHKKIENDPGAKRKEYVTIQNMHRARRIRTE